MSKATNSEVILPVGKWGRYWVYQARFKDQSKTVRCPVMIKRQRKFIVDGYVQYATLDSAFGKSMKGVPAWKIGRVSAMARNVLHLAKCEK